MSRHKLTLNYPSSWHNDMWREALPSGNGTVGVAVLGNIKQETVIINHSELWHWGKNCELPDVSDKLSQTRALMKEKRYLEASWCLTNALREKGYDTVLESPMPLADLKLVMPCDIGFSNYSRELEMETGEVSVFWQEGVHRYKRDIFASRKDDVFVYRILGDQQLNISLSLDVHKNEWDKIPERFEPIANTMKYEIDVENGIISYGITHEDGTDCGVVVKVISSHLQQSGNTLNAKLDKEILIIGKVFVKGKYEISKQTLLKDISLLPKDYDTLLKRHVDIHKPIFRSVDLELGASDMSTSNERLLLDAYGNEASNELIEKMWAYGRYLFISATSPNSLPSNMYGLWHGDYDVCWSHHMANENIQMIYWHTLTGGLMEFNQSLFRYYSERIPVFQESAKKMYGCRGIYVVAGTTPNIAYPTQIVPVIMNWTGAAGWLARHYYDYYLFSKDEEFLRTQALPFMYEAALFYEDFLVKEGVEYKYYPSVSPENTPQNFMPANGVPLAHPMPTAINATMDIAIIKELFLHMIEGATITGMHQDKIAVWEDILLHLPAYAINEEGAVKEWIDPDFEDRYDHRHLSHLYPVFPGNEINEENNKELFHAFEIAVEKRKLGAQTGWSFMHMAAIYARFGKADKALLCMDLLAQSGILNNFYTLHNDWRNMGISLNMREAPIQMDANMGWTNAVQEMLFYNSPSLIKLLPALPSRWKKGKVTDWRFVGGIVSFSWDNAKFKATFQITSDTRISVKLPNLCDSYNIQVNNNSLNTYTKDDLYCMVAQKGDCIMIRTNL